MDTKLVDWIVTNLKLTETEKADLISKNDDGEITLSDNFTQVLDTKFIAKLDKIKNDQYNKGVKDKAIGLETVLKDFGVEITMGNKVEDVLKSHLETVKSTPPSDKKLSEFTDDEVLALDVVKNKLKAEFDKYDKLQNDFTTYKTGFETKRLESVAKDKFRQILLSMNPVLPQDEKLKERQINTFINSIPLNRVKLDENNNLIPLTEDGKRLQDDRYEDASLESFVSSYNIFETHKQDPTKSSTKTDTKFEGGGSIPNFKNFQEVSTYLRTEKDPAKKEKAVEKWKQIQGQN